MERLRGGHSLLEAEDPSKCPGGNHATWRTLKCDGRTDIVECPRCGKQATASCNFDEDFA